MDFKLLAIRLNTNIYKISNLRFPARLSFSKKKVLTTSQCVYFSLHLTLYQQESSFPVQVSTKAFTSLP